MKVSYEYTKKEFEKYLLRCRLRNNIILFIVGLSLYLYLTYNKVSLIFLPLFIIGLIVLICLLNYIYIKSYFKISTMLRYDTYGKYTLELTPNKFSTTVNKIKTDYKYNSIRKLKETKRNLIIKMGGRERLTFEKRKFSDSDYNKILEYFKKKI